MDVLSILTYAALVFAAFRIFRIPVNKWTVTTSVVGGIFLVGAIFITMAYFHPYTPKGRIFFQTTPIIPQVRGIVTEVPVRNNKPLKKGDILFKIDPVPYQSALDHAEAVLDEARQRLTQYENQVGSAQAEADKSKAALDLAAVTEKRMKQLLSEQTIAQQRYDQVYARWQEAGQEYQKDLAALLESKSAIATQKAVIAEEQAKIVKARFDLECTVVRAPDDGHCVQVRLRPGMMAVPLPLKPTMTFVNDNERYLIGMFGQHPLQNLKVGHKAEVIFPALPGRCFTGKVVKIMSALGEGQLQPSANMMQTNEQAGDGRVPVFIELDQDMKKFDLPGGCVAGVAVYSEKIEFLAPIRQILLRMMSWKNIICFETI